MKKYILAPLAAFCLNWSGAAISADFVAVRIEAENFTSKNDRWALTSPDNIPDLGPDPDPPHNNSASGNANLELLPDTRVTHDDEVVNGGLDGNFWGAPGGGPRIDYDVNVPEAGRYFVYVKTYSTNTEDNGIHVALNGNLPASGQRIQICSKNNWFWTSGQRTDENHCGVTKTIWLDFPAAGVNTVTFFAREDGFEIDQFLLLKETHDGSLDCFPMFNDKIRCKDVATGANTGDTEVPISQTVDGNTDLTPPITTEPEPEPVIIQVDLEVDLNAIGATHFVGDNVEYQVKATNNSQQDTANNTTAKIDLPVNLDFNASADCTIAGSEVTCVFGNLSPGTSDTLSFTATATTAGTLRADAQVTADEDDNNSSNNIDSATINTQVSVPDFEAGVSIAQSSNVSAIGGINSYTATVINNGQQQINNATLQVTAGNGLSLQQCDPQCAVPSINSGETAVVTFSTVATQSGTYDVTAELIVPDDANNTNNTATLSASVVGAGVSISSNNLIVIEAEAFNTSSTAATESAPQWFVVDSAFTSLPEQLDPDNASYQDVSGSAYVEALPDLRIDDNDATIDGVSNFSDGGVGATLTYSVFFSQTGTYNVYVRVRSNNSQDSSLHIGLDNNWPDTANSISVCNPDGNWQWTSNTSSGTGCDTASTATISITTPGIHELMISQDTDGLELDKLILSQGAVSDLNGNGPDASSVDPTQDADISISSTLASETIAPAESTELSVAVSNSSNVTVMGVTVTITGLNDDATHSDGFDSCTTGSTATVCTISELAASQQVTGTFTITTTQSESRVIDSTVSAIQTDTNTSNNAAQVTLTSVDEPSEVKKVVTSSGGGSLSLWFLLTFMLLLAFNSTARLQIVDTSK